MGAQITKQTSSFHRHRSSATWHLLRILLVCNQTSISFITIHCPYESNVYRRWPNPGYSFRLWETIIILRSYSLKGQDEQREEEMRDYLSLPHAQPDTVQHREMKRLSHAISGSLWQSSTLNQDTDFQAAALIAKPSFQPREKKWEQRHSESHPKWPDSRWAARGLWSVSHLGMLQQHRPQQVNCDLKVTLGLVLTHNTGTCHQCWWAEQLQGLVALCLQRSLCNAWDISQLWLLSDLFWFKRNKKCEQLCLLQHDGNKGTKYAVLESQHIMEKYLRAGRNITLIKKKKMICQ